MEEIKNEKLKMKKNETRKLKQKRANEKGRKGNECGAVITDATTFRWPAERYSLTEACVTDKKNDSYTLKYTSVPLPLEGRGKRKEEREMDRGEQRDKI